MSRCLLRYTLHFFILFTGNWNVFPIDVDQKTLSYLSKFGYMEVPQSKSNFTAHLISSEAIRKAIRSFQEFAGINVTGELDAETKMYLSFPRCGVQDIITTSARRQKRYALQGSKWSSKELTYRVSKYSRTKRMSHVLIDEEIRKAFQIWSDHSDLSFVPKTIGRVNIDIRFEKGDHGDGDSFDGIGGTLAHAFFPVFGGDAHFDDDEAWTIESYYGTNLQQVMAHEFGHSLGLLHSKEKRSLMAPFYRRYDPNLSLSKDDIEGIQIHKSKTIPSDSIDESNKLLNITYSLLCQKQGIDAILEEDVDTYYVFKGKYYWKLANDGLEMGYPRLISETWFGISGNIDAALVWSGNGRTYFFKGNEYYRFKNHKLDPGYPKNIKLNFPGIPNDIDAVFTWPRDKFWRFEPNKTPPVDDVYPKKITVWKGIEDNIDDVVVYKGKTYFFKDNNYWRFDDSKISVDMNSNPPFPRNTGDYWFGCPKIEATLNKNYANLMKSLADNIRKQVSNSGMEVLVAEDYNGFNSSHQFKLSLSGRILLIFIISIFYLE